MLLQGSELVSTARILSDYSKLCKKSGWAVGIDKIKDNMDELFALFVAPKAVEDSIICKKLRIEFLMLFIAFLIDKITLWDRIQRLLCFGYKPFIYKLIEAFKDECMREMLSE